MVKYVTRSTLSDNLGSLNEQRATVSKAESRSPSGATFLSHSTKDSDLLPAVINILERHGATVYVDKKDDTLPPYTNRQTAINLRERIKQSKKFVLFTTKNSKDSRWVPWELGLSDGYKTPKNVAIFPSVEQATETAWTTTEYLGVYNRIVFGGLQNYSKDVFMVWDQEANMATELSVWLKE